MTRHDLIERAVPEGYQIAWRFCWLPTLVAGRTVWLRSIPVLKRCIPSVAMGINWGDQWVTVAVLDDADGVGASSSRPARKPAPAGDFF